MCHWFWNLVIVVAVSLPSQIWWRWSIWWICCCLFLRHPPSHNWGTTDSRLKGLRFESRQERRENFLLHGQFSVLTLISVSVLHLCYRSNTEKIPVILSKVQVAARLQLNTHALYICGFEKSDTVNWCMVVWCSQNLCLDGSSFTWHQPCNNQTASVTTSCHFNASSFPPLKPKLAHP